MEKEYLTIGKKITIGGMEFFQQGFYDDGITFGSIYKNERAFCEQPDEICYVPESSFDFGNLIIYNGEEYHDTGGYTRKDLELLLENEDDCDGEAIDIEYFFDKLCWASPEVYLNEMQY